MNHKLKSDIRMLSIQEQKTINGGSEFSEDVVRNIGWLIGVWYAGLEDYYMMKQAKKYSE